MGGEEIEENGNERRLAFPVIDGERQEGYGDRRKMRGGGGDER